jgi:hypothetical protein
VGNYLLEHLGDRGFETESLTLRASLNREEGEAALLAACDRAGLILLVFPLYADALPFLVTKALTVIATHRRAATAPPPQRLVAIVNSGFPETHQNSLALAIRKESAGQSGMAWDGGLALGGGLGAKDLSAKQPRTVSVKNSSISCRPHPPDFCPPNQPNEKDCPSWSTVTGASGEFPPPLAGIGEHRP